MRHVQFTGFGYFNPGWHGQIEFAQLRNEGIITEAFYALNHPHPFVVGGCAPVALERFPEAVIDQLIGQPRHKLLVTADKKQLPVLHMVCINGGAVLIFASGHDKQGSVIPIRTGLVKVFRGNSFSNFVLLQEVVFFKQVGQQHARQFHTFVPKTVTVRRGSLLQDHPQQFFYHIPNEIGFI